MKNIILIAILAILSHVSLAQQESVKINLPSGKVCEVSFKDLTISTTFSSKEDVYVVLKEVRSVIKEIKTPGKMFFDIYLKTENKTYYCNYLVSKKPREI
jgi:hypothetical protein